MATQQPSKTTLPPQNRVRLRRGFAIFVVSVVCLFGIATGVTFGVGPLRTAAERLGFVSTDHKQSDQLATNTFEAESDEQVLGLATGDPALRFHLPTFFSDVLTAAGLSITGESVFEGSITVNNDVQINGNLFANNLINSVTAGAGLEVTGTGDITIANTDPGSAQTIFKTIKIEDDSITAGANDDTITFLAGDNVELSTDGNEVTITSNQTFTDNDTTYTAGNGLNLTSTTFSLKSALTTVTSITVPDGGIIDLSNITHSSSTPQGLKLPQNTAANLTAMTGAGEGFIAWSSDENRVKQFDGTNWADLATAGGGGTTEWTDAGAYIYPDENDYLGNATSGGGNKLAGAYFADSSPLVFGTDNDITTSFASAVLGYSIGNNDINFDSNTLFIDGSADRVGIGTSSPTTNLDVQGSARISGALYDSSNSAGTSGYILASTGAGTQWSSSIAGGLITADSLDFTELKDALTLDADTSINVYDGSADRDFRIYNSDSSDELFFVDASTGRIGIGTTSPGAKLEIDGSGTVLLLPQENTSSSPAIAFGDGDTGFYEVADDLIGISIGGVRRGFWGSQSSYTGIFGESNTSPFINLGSGTTAGAPAYSYRIDTDTGMYNPAANEIGFTVGGSEQLRLTSSGALGIGTTSPSYKLDVNGTFGTNSTVNLSGLSADDATSTKVLALDASNNVELLDLSSATLPSGTDGQTLYNNSGTWTATSNFYNDGTNVGIGTTSPSSGAGFASTGLTIADLDGTSEYPFLSLKNSIRSWTLIGGLSGGFGIREGTNNDYFFISNTGSVGIGTTSPSYTLDVNGTFGTNSTVNLSGLSADDATSTKVLALDASNNVELLDLSSATLPSGTDGQTLYNDSGTWAATSNLYNNGTNVGIGTVSPTARFYLTGAANATSPFAQIQGYAIGGSPLLKLVQQNSAGNSNLIEGYNATSTLSYRVTDGGNGYFAGSVGIGTTAPTYTLDVSGTIASHNSTFPLSSVYTAFSSNDLTGLQLNTHTGSYWRIRSSGNAGDSETFSISNAGGATPFLIKGDNPANNNALTIDTTGYIGIGTTSPSYTLDVNGTFGTNSTVNLSGLSSDDATSTKVLALDASNNVELLDLSSATLPSGTNGQTLYNNSGTWAATSNLYNNGTNVGIGTTSPGYKLDVSGDVFARNYFVGINGNYSQGLVWNDTTTGAGSVVGHKYADSGTNYGMSILYNAYRENATSVEPFKRLRANYEPIWIEMSGHNDGYNLYSASAGNADTDISWTRRFRISGSGIVSIGPNSEFAFTTTGAISKIDGVAHTISDESGNLTFGSNANLILNPSAGNVGIGTTSPSTQLHIYNTTSADTLLTMTGTDNGYATGLSLTSGAGANWKILSQESYASNALLFGTGAPYAMAISTGGNVGIGSISPAAKLDVIGDIYTSSGLSTFSTAVSDGTIEATQFCTGDGESNCVSDFAGIGASIGVGDLSDMNISSPAGGQVLVYDGTDSWDNRYLTNDILVSTTGAVTIQPNAVALAFDTTGNYVASINAGNGLTSTGSTTGENISHTLYVNTGNGLQISSDAVALGALTTDWSQTAAYDIIMNNADAQIQMLESTGGTYYGTIDVGDLSANATYTLSGTSGTILTSANASTVLSGWDTDATDDLLGTNLTSGYLPYYDGDTTLANSVLYTNGTNVGIGTTSPAYLLDMLSTSTSTGALFNGYWNPGSATTFSGDVFKLNIGANANLTGNIFGLYDNGTPLFTVSPTKITSSIPHEFLSAGDVSFAYDAVFTNSTASYITYEGPGYIRTNHPSGNYDLTLSAANAGSVVIADMLEVFTTDPAVYFNTASAGDTDFWAGVIEDASGDDNDIFGIGDGLVLGTNTFFAIDSAGNIGIGTTTAAYKLDVNGDVRIASGSDLYIGSIGFNDVGTDRITSGASLIGVYDEFGNSDSTTVQDVLDDLDASIAAMANSGQYDRIVAADGSGTDTTIAAAITNSSAGDTIFIKAGSYSENITISKSLTIIGAGIEAVTIAGSTGSPTINIAGGINDVLIADLTATNAGTATTDSVIADGDISANNRIKIHSVETSGGYYGIYLRTTHTSSITQARISGSANDGIYLNGTDDSLVAHNTVSSAGDIGIHVGLGSLNARIIGNYVLNSADDGLYLSTANYSTTTGNIVKNAGDNGISLYQTDYATVSNNTIQDSFDVGIYNSTSDYLSIGNNTIDVSGEEGMYFANANYITITGNVIKDSTLDGIDASYSLNSDINIVGNTIEGSGEFGVDINGSGDPENMYVASNILRNNTSGSVDIPDPSSNSVVANNSAAGDIDTAQFSYHPTTGNTFAQDLIQLTMDGADANSFTGNALKFIVDQSQVTGNILLAQDDGATDIFRINKSGDLYSAGSARFAASSYLNFGATSGSSGYGIRDNAGTIEYKNSGGSWSSLGISADSLDYTELADSMTLDANYSIAQAGYTWTQSFTGTTSDAFSFLADSLTTANAYDISVDALTSGNAIYIESTSTALTTGSLFNGYWNPSSATTATGDLFKLDIGSNATLTGNLFALYNNGSKLFSVSTSKITSALPHEFTSAGDVSFAYDIVMTNQTANFISSYGPMTIVSGESYENLDLTLKAYGTGSVVIDQAALLMNTGEKLTLDSDDSADTYLAHNNAGNYLSVFSDGTESVRFMSDGSVDGNTTFDANQFDLAEYYPTLDSELSAGDVVAVQSVEGNDASVAPYLVEKAEASEEQQPVLGVVSTRPGFSLGGGSFRSELCTLVASGSDGEQAARQQLFIKEVTDSIINEEFTVESLEAANPESEGYQQLLDSAAIELYAQYVDDAELAVPQTRIDTVEDQINTCKALKQVPIALSGRVPVKIDTANGEIKPGDLLTLSPGETGKAAKAVGPGWVIGRALESSKDNDTVMVFVFTAWYGGGNTVVSNLGEGSVVTAGSPLGSGTISGSTAGDAQITSQLTAVMKVTSTSGASTLQIGKDTPSLTVDFFNGKVRIGPDGTVVSMGAIQAKQVKAEEFTVLGASDDAGSSSSLSSSVLEAGETEITIENSFVKATSKVFITPTSDTAGQVLVVTEKTDGEFTVTIKESQSEDITFDYWIVQTE